MPLHGRTTNTLGRPIVAALAALWVAGFVVGCSGAPLPGGDGGATFEPGDALQYRPGVIGAFRSVVLPGPGGEPWELGFEVIDGLAIIEGDVILGTVEEIEGLAGGHDVMALGNEVVPFCWESGLGGTDCLWARWTDAVVPYSFKDDWGASASGGDQDAMMRARILAAMRQIEAVSILRFVPYANQPNRLIFRSSDGCSSKLGMKPGGQYVNLSVACVEGTVVHEIMHALGFLHEQSRHDRDQYVAIQWDNIKPYYKPQFDQKSYGSDIGHYDYDSIMHYHAYAFCEEAAGGGCVGPTIVTVPPGVPIGQRNALSAVDIAGINLLYPGLPPVITIAEPAPWSGYSRRATNVFLAADVSDPEGQAVEVTWTSSGSGVLGTGNPLTAFTGDMAYGLNVVTAVAEDPQGNTATAAVLIQITNDPPVVDVVAPTTGVFCSGEPIDFRAAVLDVNEPGATLPDGRVAWRIAGEAPFATGKEVARSFPNVGGYRVIVRATDEVEAFDEDYVDLTIQACTNLPPEVAITVPPSDVTYTLDGYDDVRGLWYKDLTLSGTAIDPEDGALGGSALVWRTNQIGVQEALLGTGTSVAVRLYTESHTATEHVVTLTATDSDGNARSAVVRIVLWTLG